MSGAFGHPINELQRDFGDDPWRLVTHGIDPELAGQDETLFSLGNGYLGLRGNHEEGLPLGSHGTFINGFHETWRIQHAENAYGFAEQGQTIVNVPDAKTIRIYVDDERLNLRSADIVDVTRILDMRSGTLTRSLLWLTPTGKRVRVETRRMVSFVFRHLVTLEMRITVLDSDAEVTVSSLLLNRQDLGRVTTEQPAARDSAWGAAGAAAAAGSAAPGSGSSDAGIADPRKSEEITERILYPGPVSHDGDRSIVSYRTGHSGMMLAVGVDHEFDSGDLADPDQPGSPGQPGLPGAWRRTVERSPDRVRHVFQGTARANTTVKLVKTAAYHSSSTASLPDLIDRCTHTLAQARLEPAEQRWEAQRRFLDDFWARSDVRVDAEPGVQQAVRWNLLQLAQSAARADGRGIAAKGLSGSGYSGHYFWDSEVYVLPFLTYTTPLWARNALRSREQMLPQARRRAAQLNEDGALFPWRTIGGEEASAYYAAGTAQYHINADITYALARYIAASGDYEYLATGACDIAIETARLWNSLGFWRRDDGGVDRFHIHGVTGPDEYTTVVNDNLFTNTMARFNLRFAAEVARGLAADSPEAYAAMSARLRLDLTEVEGWEKAAEGMSIPYDQALGIHPQDAQFLEREVWDLAATPPEQKPLLLHFHPLVIYRFQVLKQADVVLALLLASDEFGRAEKQRDFEYYDALTTGDSTLSGVVQSIIAAEVGYPNLAYRYFDHALRVDLDNLHQNSADGVHVASAGGVWMMLVQGFAGMRDAGRKLAFDPRLPAHWGALAFSLAWRGATLEVTLTRDHIAFTVGAGDPAVTVHVRGREVLVTPGAGASVPLENQGPDLGTFDGLSAGMLPREGATGVIQTLRPDVPVVTTSIPTLPARHPG